MNNLLRMISLYKLPNYLLYCMTNFRLPALCALLVKERSDHRTENSLVQSNLFKTDNRIKRVQRCSSLVMSEQMIRNSRRTKPLLEDIT